MWQHSSRATAPQHIKDRNLSQHLLCYQPENLEEGILLRVWTDLDYGGFNILAILRKHVSPCFEPYWIDLETLENHSQWTRSLTKTDDRNLKCLFHHLALVDAKPGIVNLLQRNLKLE